MRPGSTATPEFTGRKCYRLPGDPWDERPCLLIRNPWESDGEREAYTQAVRSHPRKPDEGAFAYIVRLAGIVAQGPLAAPLKAFPPAHRMNREYAGPRPETPELSHEARLDAIFSEREPGSDDE